jgi:methylamine dehydrogenase accessory protein MauD
MEWTTVGLISYLVLWVVVVIQVVLTLALARLVGQLSRRLPPAGARVIDPGPELGTRVESWEGVDLLGNPVAFRFPRDRGLFLLYLSPHCSMCAALIPAAKRFFQEIDTQAEGVWVMVLGSREAQLAYARGQGLIRRAVLPEDQLPPTWRVEGAPFGLWINPAGAVEAKGMVNQREHLESLRNAAEMGHASVQSYLAAAAEEKERQREASAGHP